MTSYFHQTANIFATKRTIGDPKKGREDQMFGFAQEDRMAQGLKNIVCWKVSIWTKSFSEAPMFGPSASGGPSGPDPASPKTRKDFREVIDIADVNIVKG